MYVCVFVSEMSVGLVIEPPTSDLQIFLTNLTSCVFLCTGKSGRGGEWFLILMIMFLNFRIVFCFHFIASYFMDVLPALTSDVFFFFFVFNIFLIFLLFPPVWLFISGIFSLFKS